MRTAKRIFAEFMTVVMVLQACSPTVAAVAAGWQNISNEIAAASAKALDTAESGETNGDVTIGSGSSDAGADSDSAGDDAVKDDAAAIPPIAPLVPIPRATRRKATMPLTMPPLTTPSKMPTMRLRRTLMPRRVRRSRI